MTATATPPPDAPAGQEPLPASVTAVVGLLVLFEVTSGFLQVGLAPLLPDLADHLGIGSAALNWVVSVQLLAAAVCVPLFGRLGDLHGHRRMLRIALALIAAGTLVVALAPDYGTLLMRPGAPGTGRRPAAPGDRPRTGPAPGRRRTAGHRPSGGRADARRDGRMGW